MKTGCWAMKRELDPDFREEETAIVSREPETAPVGTGRYPLAKHDDAFGAGPGQEKLIRQT